LNLKKTPAESSDRRNPPGFNRSPNPLPNARTAPPTVLHSGIPVDYRLGPAPAGPGPLAARIRIGGRSR
jgi:hypothetical protein